MKKLALTSAQTKALETIRAGKFQKLESAHNGDLIKTGVNTTTLHNLRKAGLISCTGIYLSGVTTADLKVVS